VRCETEGFDEVGVTGRGGQSQCEMGLPENGGTILKKQRSKNTKREKKIGEMWDRQLRLIDVVEWWILS